MEKRRHIRGDLFRKERLGNRRLRSSSYRNESLFRGFFSFFRRRRGVCQLPPTKIYGGTRATFNDRDHTRRDLWIMIAPRLVL